MDGGRIHCSGATANDEGVRPFYARVGYYARPSMAANASEISAGHQRGCAAWPAVALSLERFFAHVARLDLEAAALEPNAADLFLVMGALDGDACALAALDEEFVRPACGVTARIDRTPEFLADVQQQLRLKLLAGPEPSLGHYRGQGPLLPWLRVAALRTAINLKRSDRLLPTPDAALEPLLGATDAEHEAARRLYLESFQRAMENSFQRLTPRERTLMHLHFVEGLNIDTIGGMYGAHRATVARWLAAIRRTILAETRALLAASHGLGSGSVRSLYRMLEPDLHLTLSRLLDAQPAPPAAAASAQRK